MKLLQFILLLTGLTFLTHCQVKKAEVPKGFEVPEVQIIPAKDISITESFLFLWKKDTTVEQSTAVLTEAKKIDVLSEKILPFYKRQREIEEKLKVFESTNPLSENDMKRQSELMVEKQSLDENIKVLDKQINVAVQTIQDNVDLSPNQPSSIDLYVLKNGSYGIDISEWGPTPDDEPMGFSTRDKTIKNVSYNPNGGILKFDVLVYTNESQEMLRETYSFKAVRNKLENNAQENKDDSVHFGGEYKRIMNPAFCQLQETPPDCDDRYGQVKLCGKITQF